MEYPTERDSCQALDNMHCYLSLSLLVFLGNFTLLCSVHSFSHSFPQSVCLSSVVLFLWGAEAQPRPTAVFLYRKSCTLNTIQLLTKLILWAISFFCTSLVYAMKGLLALSLSHYFFHNAVSLSSLSDALTGMPYFLSFYHSFFVSLTRLVYD